MVRGLIGSQIHASKKDKIAGGCLTPVWYDLGLILQIIDSLRQLKLYLKNGILTIKNFEEFWSLEKPMWS